MLKGYCSGRENIADGKQSGREGVARCAPARPIAR